MKKIVFVGDSIVYGWPYGQEYSFVRHLEKYYPEASLINKGIPGDSLSNMLMRIDSYLEESDLLIINGGINDIIQGYSLAGINSKLEGIIEKTQKRGKKMLLILPSPSIAINLEREIEFLKQKMRRTCEQANIQYLDLRPYFLNDEKRLDRSKFRDDVHWQEETYRGISDYLHKTLNKSFTKV